MLVKPNTHFEMIKLTYQLTNSLKYSLNKENTIQTLDVVSQYPKYDKLIEKKWENRNHNQLIKTIRNRFRDDTDVEISKQEMKDATIKHMVIKGRLICGKYF